MGSKFNSKFMSNRVVNKLNHRPFDCRIKILISKRINPNQSDTIRERVSESQAFTCYQVNQQTTVTLTLSNTTSTN